MPRRTFPVVEPYYIKSSRGRPTTRFRRRSISHLSLDLSTDTRNTAVYSALDTTSELASSPLACESTLKSGGNLFYRALHIWCRLVLHRGGTAGHKVCLRIKVRVLCTTRGIYFARRPILGNTNGVCGEYAAVSHIMSHADVCAFALLLLRCNYRLLTLLLWRVYQYII